MLGFVPRDNRIRLFGNLARFADNTKYLFLHAVSAKIPNTRTVWIARDSATAKDLKSKGFPAVIKRSLEGLWLCLRAKYYVYACYPTDICFWQSRNATLINLWHGTPLKKIEHDISSGPYKREYTFLKKLSRPWLCISPSFILSSSRWVCANMLSSAFRLPQERCVVLGYPRLDILYQERETVLAAADKIENLEYNQCLKKLSNFKRVILYLPTFRDGQPNDLDLDVAEIESICQKHDAIFVVKQHPVYETSKSESTKGNLDRLMVLDSQWDIYPILAIADILITDYSSIIFDFMLTRRPIILYQYDRERHAAECREFYIPPDELGIGKNVRTAQELFAALNELLSGSRTKNYTEDSIERFHEFQDGHSSARVLDFLSQLSNCNLSVN